MRRLVVGLYGLLFAGLVLAAGPAAVRKRVELSMLANGTIVVAPDGSVRSYALDRPEKLPQPVVDLVHQAVPAWRFQPVLVDGKPVVAEAKMTVRFVASPADKGDYLLKISGASFGDSDGKSSDQIAYKERSAPKYPQDAARARVAGTVYLVLRVGRDGQVADASADQVNLTVVGSDSELRVWRKVLADASLSKARTWTFTPPTTGPHAMDDFWVVRTPITFTLHEQGAPRVDTYGQWLAYVPGPKEPVPWMEKLKTADDGKNGVTDALPEGGLSLVGSGLTLTTPLQSS
jgi:hypothetical protein